MEIVDAVQKALVTFLKDMDYVPGRELCTTVEGLCNDAFYEGRLMEREQIAGSLKQVVKRLEY